MNNDNFNNINYMAHDIINNINKISHDILNTTIHNSVPIINTFANTNLQNNNITVINYKIKHTTDNIYIFCELPGVSKENCRVNYSNQKLIISGKTSNSLDINEDKQNLFCEENWLFLKEKNYYREIDLINVDKKNIKVKYINGCLYIVILKKNLDSKSDINID